jgi:hypothetical protein
MKFTHPPGCCLRRRQAATANRQHVTVHNRPARPANTPTIIGVQFEGEDVDRAGPVDVGKQNSPV